MGVAVGPRLSAAIAGALLVVVVYWLGKSIHSRLAGLLAAGLTLVFGIMSFVNLAHGSLYMVGAYAGAVAYNAIATRGTLMKNAARHEIESTSRPPMKGPRIVVAAEAPAHNPKARR